MRGALRPFLVQRLPVAADDVDLRDRAGHGVEAGRQHQRVGLVILAGDAHGVFGDLLDRIGLDVDQLDIRPVEGREIVGVDADALGADRVAVRLQQLCRGGVLDDLGDLAADEIGGGVVGGLVEQEVVVDGHEHHAAMLPAGLVSGAALIVAVVERAAVGLLGVDAVARHFAREAADFRIVVA